MLTRNTVESVLSRAKTVRVRVTEKRGNLKMTTSYTMDRATLACALQDVASMKTKHGRTYRVDPNTRLTVLS